MLDFLAYFWDLLSFLGLSTKKGKLLFLGLDNAGKTTLLHMLKDDKLAVHEPTQRPTKEQLTIGSVQFETFDLGGHEEAREVWGDYYVDASAIIFIVDANDRDRMDEARAVLAELLVSEDLRDVPVVVLGNKIDLPKAASEGELRARLYLQKTSGKDARAVAANERPVEVFMCSIAKRRGYGEAIRWVAQFI